MTVEHLFSWWNSVCSSLHWLARRTEVQKTATTLTQHSNKRRLHYNTNVTGLPRKQCRLQRAGKINLLHKFNSFTSIAYLSCSRQGTEDIVIRETVFPALLQLTIQSQGNQLWLITASFSDTQESPSLAPPQDCSSLSAGQSHMWLRCSQLLAIHQGRDPRDGFPFCPKTYPSAFQTNMCFLIPFPLSCFWWGKLPADDQCPPWAWPTQFTLRLAETLPNYGL